MIFAEDESFLNAGDLGRQEKHLAAIVHHLNAAWTAFQELHPMVLAELNQQYRANARAYARRTSKTALEVAEEFEVDSDLLAAVPLNNVLRRVLYILTGKSYIEPYEVTLQPATMPSAIETARARAKELTLMSGKALAEQTWKKVRLVESNIECWQSLGAGKPHIGSAMFQNLLQGLADGLDPEGQRNWDAGDLVRCYRRVVNLGYQNHK